MFFGALSAAHAGESGLGSCGRPKKYLARVREEVNAPRLSIVTTRPKRTPVVLATRGKADWICDISGER